MELRVVSHRRLVEHVWWGHPGECRKVQLRVVSLAHPKDVAGPVWSSDRAGPAYAGKGPENLQLVHQRLFPTAEYDEKTAGSNNKVRKETNLHNQKLEKAREESVLVSPL